MAVSNSTTWELNRDQIIEAALRKLGVLAQGGSASTIEKTNAQMALNGLIARFNTLGMSLWKRTEQSVALASNVSTYTLSNAIKVPEVYLRSLTGNSQYKLQWKSDYDIKNLPYSSTGVPVHWSFTPNLAEGGTLRIWPTPTNSEVSEYSLRVIYQKEFDTFTDAAETPDFPAYWTDALIFGLALSLSPEYGISLQDRQFLEKQALVTLAQAQSYGDEDGSLYFGVHQYS